MTLVLPGGRYPLTMAGDYDLINACFLGVLCVMLLMPVYMWRLEAEQMAADAHAKAAQADAGAPENVAAADTAPGDVAVAVGPGAAQP